MTAPRSVSVIIPARNAAQTIGAQLDALTRQDYQGPIEVVVADNGSTDGTASVAVNGWKGRFPSLRVVPAHERAGPGYARNVAISAATHEFVLMCDADDVVHSSWVRNLATALEGAGAVAGGFAPWSDRERPPSEVRYQRFVSGFLFLPAFSTASAATRRSTWASVGGFDEELPTGEDMDYAWRVQLAGHQMAICPDAYVFYREPSNRRTRLKRAFSYGRQQPRLFAKFAGSGMRRQSLIKVMATWLSLIATSYLLLASPERRLRYCDFLGIRVGRIAGSIETGTLYL